MVLSLGSGVQEEVRGRSCLCGSEIISLFAGSSELRFPQSPNVITSFGARGERRDRIQSALKKPIR